MLIGSKIKMLCAGRNMSFDQLAGHMAHGAFDRAKALTALKNWQKGLYKPLPTSGDVDRIADALGVDKRELCAWQASYRYAPTAPRKARLITELISGRDVQDALDVLKFEHRRAASMVKQVLESAIANADEAEADVESLYISEARVDGAGRRIGTKTWIAKDRGRAHPICKKASHIHITVAEG